MSELIGQFELPNLVSGQSDDARVFQGLDGGREHYICLISKLGVVNKSGYFLADSIAEIEDQDNIE